MKITPRMKASALVIAGLVAAALQVALYVCVQLQLMGQALSYAFLLCPFTWISLAAFVFLVLDWNPDKASIMMTVEIEILCLIAMILEYWGATHHYYPMGWVLLGILIVMTGAAYARLVIIGYAVDGVLACSIDSIKQANAKLNPQKGVSA